MTFNKITIKCPEGFIVKYKYRFYNNKLDAVTCYLYDKSKPHNIGFLFLEKNNGGSLITHSELDPEYHGRGFGTFLYSKGIAWALNHGYRVRSSGDSSSMAQRVWEGKGLRERFNIRKHTDNTFSFTRTTWYATKKRATKRKNK